MPLVFHRNGKVIRDFRGAWETACKTAGCPGRILHDFRRTAVRNLERAGVPRSSAMAMVGHGPKRSIADTQSSTQERCATRPRSSISSRAQFRAQRRQDAKIPPSRRARDSPDFLGIWCRRRGSNPHGRKAHRILSPARLPVSPLRHEVDRPILSTTYTVCSSGFPLQIGDCPRDMSLRPAAPCAGHPTRTWLTRLSRGHPDGYAPPSVKHQSTRRRLATVNDHWGRLTRRAGQSHPREQVARISPAGASTVT